MATGERAERIRIEGIVQGVGFRVHVLRLARRYRLRGWVANVGSGVTTLACGPAAQLDAFVRAIVDEAPVGACVERIERSAGEALPADAGFVIV